MDPYSNSLYIWIHNIINLLTKTLVKMFSYENKMELLVQSLNLRNKNCSKAYKRAMFRLYKVNNRRHVHCTRYSSEIHLRKSRVVFRSYLRIFLMYRIPVLCCIREEYFIGIDQLRQNCPGLVGFFCSF